MNFDIEIAAVGLSEDEFTEVVRRYEEKRQSEQAPIHNEVETAS